MSSPEPNNHDKGTAIAKAFGLILAIEEQTLAAFLEIGRSGTGRANASAAELHLDKSSITSMFAGATKKLGMSFPDFQSIASSAAAGGLLNPPSPDELRSICRTAIEYAANA